MEALRIDNLEFITPESPAWEPAWQLLFKHFEANPTDGGSEWPESWQYMGSNAARTVHQFRNRCGKWTRPDGHAFFIRIYVTLCPSTGELLATGRGPDGTRFDRKVDATGRVYDATN